MRPHLRLAVLPRPASIQAGLGRRWLSTPTASGPVSSSIGHASAARNARRVRRAGLYLLTAASALGATALYVQSSRPDLAAWCAWLAQECSVATGSAPTLPVTLDLAGASAKLRREQATFYFRAGGESGGGGALGRADVARLASNWPVEDQWDVRGATRWLGSAARYLPAALLPAPGWSFFGVYDGHAGWATAALLRRRLAPAVRQAVNLVPPSPASQGGDEASTAAAAREFRLRRHSNAIRDTFLGIDSTIMEGALAAMRRSRGPGDAATIAAMAPAIAGSCALLACYNAAEGILHVACTGDSRAVLGRAVGGLGPDPAPRYAAVALSEDQGGRSALETARLAGLHPDEPEMLKGLREQGRLFGLAVTRAFGDHRWKYDTDTLRHLHESYFGTAPRPGALTQPYLTAEPEVTETTIGRGDRDGGGVVVRHPDFAILASDGLWDHISSEEAVECVQGWVEAKRAGRLDGSGSGGGSKRAGRRLGGSGEQDDGGGDGGGGGEADKRLFNMASGYAEWQYKHDWFVAEDDNAATHLVRNVLGGRHRALFCGLLSTYAPMSRNVRDDITVQVIFFGDV